MIGRRGGSRARVALVTFARSREAALRTSSHPRFVASASGVLVAVTTAVVALAGCSQPTDEDNATKLSTAESELKLSGARYMGRINAGETKTVLYDPPPSFRALGFDAKPGDEITVTVTSLHGDAMGWITDSNYQVLASNDDASPYTLDSRVTYTVPKSTTRRAYRIVFRDYDMLDASFNISLAIKSAAGNACTYEGQTYPTGSSFPAADGCNTCSCTSTGSVACTKIACNACNPASEPNRNYLGTPQSCMTIRFTCQAGWRPFQNNCGCGCERVN